MAYADVEERAPVVNVWVEAARPRTLPASAAPVLVGTAAGAMSGGLVWWRFALALLVALAVQVAVNYANDYFDGVRGVDTVTRAGPRRAVASGLVSPPKIVTAGMLLAAVGVPLAARSPWPLLALLAVPLAWEPVTAVREGSVGRALIPALGGVGRLELAVAVLLAAGLLLA